MRVISGKSRGIRLEDIKGKEIRPTIDRYKEDVFNIINQDIVGSVFLDLFSGTGSIGLEALSRGASQCYFVDKNRNAIEVIKNNIKRTKLIENNIVLKYDYKEALNSLCNVKFDYIYLDPPFNKDLEKNVILRIKELDLLSKNGTVICECSKDTDFSFLKEIDYSVQKEKIYKYCKFVFIKRNE